MIFKSDRASDNPNATDTIQVQQSLAELSGPAAQARKTGAWPTRRSGLGYVILWSLAIGLGAMAAGAFVGFLVNGPPNRSTLRTVADVLPPTPAVTSPVAKQIAETKVPAPAPPPSAAPASPVPAPVATATAETAPLAKPAPTDAAYEPSAAPAPAPSPSAAGLAAGEIREVQGRLRTVGFNPGPIDGSAGPMTATAVKQYQQARGLAPTGTVDGEVLAKLRQERPPRQQARAPAHNYASAPPPPAPRRNDFLDSIDRWFRSL